MADYGSPVPNPDIGRVGFGAISDSVCGFETVVEMMQLS